MSWGNVVRIKSALKLSGVLLGAAFLSACFAKSSTPVGGASEVYAVRAVVRCKQNSPDGEVNLRASPSPSAAILDVLKLGRSLVKVGEAPGPGCNRPWAKLEHDKGYVYGCGEIMNCYNDKSAPAADVESDASKGATAEIGQLARCVPNQGISSVNLRSAPSVYDSRVLATVTASTSIRLAGIVPAAGGCSDSWYKLIGQTHTVYACSSIVKCAAASASTSNSQEVSSVLPTRVVESAGGVELDVPYLCQYKNSVAPGGTCQVTAFAMGYQFLTGRSIDPDYLAFDRFSFQSPDGVASHARKHYGLPGSYARTAGTEEEMKRELRAGRPIVLNTCGTWSGHVVLIVGYNSEGWIVNDPAGRWSGAVFNNPAVGCAGFPNDNKIAYSIHCNGRKVLYKYATLRRAASDGASTHNYWYAVLAK
jgi:hypothetical protein